MPDLYEQFDKYLNRLTDDVPASYDIEPDRVTSGASVATTSQTIGVLQSGKLTFSNDENGYIMGLDEGVGKMYVGTATSYLNFDGTDVSMTGAITATSGDIGGWNIVSGYIYSLASGTPTSTPSDGLVLASGNEAMIVYENTQKRVELGYLSTGVYGLKLYADNGSTVILEASDTQMTFDGAYLGALSVSAGSIANATITATQIANATITGGKIATATIEATNIANATITGTQVASGTITSDNITNATIVGGDIADATIAGSNIAAVTIAAGNIIAATITATEIANNTITAGQITASTITTSEIADNTIVAGNIAASTITTSEISGTAGILGGQIANLTIAAGNITNLTITSAQIANTTITGGKIASDTITGSLLKIGNQSWSHDLVFSSTDADTVAWASGTITMADGSTTYSIDAGNTGDMAARTYIYLDIVTSVTVLQTTTTAGTAVGDGKILIAVAEDSTTEASFQVYGGIGGIAISGGDIENASIVAAQIATNAITESKVLADAITATKIAVSGLDGTSGDVATDHIIAGMIQTNAVTSVKINADAVTAAKINVVGLDGTSGRIVVADATDANVVTGGINSHATTLITAGKIVISSTTNLDDWRKTGDLTMIDGGSISTGTVTATQILANTITASEIGANVITASEIFAGTITTTEIAANTIVAGNIAAATITGTEIAATTIAAGNIAANTITASQIASGTITATEITGTTLSAIYADLGTITAGNITLNTSGFIRTSGKDNYADTTAGIFLGYDTDAYKLNMGNDTDYLKWTGSALSMLCSGENAITIEHGSDILLQHGGDIKFTSVTAPTVCTAALITIAGNVDVGAHKYKVTFVNDNGETELGTASNTVTTDATHKQVSLSAIPKSTSGSVTSRKIYRTKAGGTAYHFLDTIADNTTTTYTDNTGDNFLSDTLWTNKENTTFGGISINGIQSFHVGSNTFVGGDSGKDNSGGYENTAIGFQSFYGNTFGYSNTTVGHKSLYSNSIGYGNTAIGSNALQDTTTGIHNVAIGLNALISNVDDHRSVAVGYNSLATVNGGWENVAVGYNSLYSTTTGYDNVAIGPQAGQGNTTGYRNVFIGYSAGYGFNQKVDAVNSIAIGYSSYTTASNQVHIGNSSISWIGGQVVWSTYSDERMKEDVKDYDHGLDLILNLRPVDFIIKGSKERERHSGFIAQEVESIGVPFYGITKPPVKNDFYSLSYAEFVVPLVKAIQEQQEQINELKQKIE